jgi:hypothetical protein
VSPKAFPAAGASAKAFPAAGVLPKAGSAAGGAESVPRRVIVRHRISRPRPAAAAPLSTVLLRNAVFTANHSSQGHGRSSCRHQITAAM